MGKKMIEWLDLEGHGPADMLYLESATKRGTSGICRVKHLHLSVT